MIFHSHKPVLSEGCFLDVTNKSKSAEGHNYSMMLLGCPGPRKRAKKKGYIQ